MTNAEAAEKLKTMKYKYMIKRSSSFSKAIDVAVKALLTDVIYCGECEHWDKKRQECRSELAVTEHEGGASYSLDRDAFDYCSFGERGEL